MKGLRRRRIEKKITAAVLTAAVVFCLLFAGKALAERGESGQFPTDGEALLTAPQSGFTAVYERVTGKTLDGNPFLSAQARSFERRAVWFSYLDWQALLSQKTEAELVQAVDQIAANCAALGLNTIILQLRAFGDAFYPSSYYPWSRYLLDYGVSPDYDPLALFIKAAKAYDLSVEGWVNPFRLTTESYLKRLSKDFPLGKLYRDAQQEEIMRPDQNGIYWLNPANKKARALICNGLKELCKRYELSGIQFDDYFYSGVSPEGFGYGEADAREALDAFMRQAKKTIQSVNDALVLTISPQGVIDDALNPASDQRLYTSLKKWCEDGVVDELIPQVYYGFSHDTADFAKMVTRWKELIGTDAKLSIGLAFYKCGEEDNNAGSGALEWQETGDMIKRQAAYLEEEGISGFSLFRYCSIYNAKDSAEDEKEALAAFLQE